MASRKNWLFNLKNDPTEQVNLAKKRPDKVKELQALLTAHHRNSKPSLYLSTADSAVMIDKTLADKFQSGDEYIYWPN